MAENVVVTNRSNFPYCLHQPEDGFRFGTDALALLEFASCVKLPSPGKIVDIGCGCGVLGLGLLLQYLNHEGIQAIGLDNNPQMLSLATENATGLDLPFHAVNVDIQNSTSIKAIKYAQAKYGFDLAVCNPPWRLIQSGRAPLDHGRKNAMYGDRTTLYNFISTADYLLNRNGCLLLVCGAERLADCMRALPERLHPVRLRLVHPRPSVKAVFCLIEARKQSRAELVTEPPLLLSQN